VVASGPRAHDPASQPTSQGARFRPAGALACLAAPIPDPARAEPVAKTRDAADNGAVRGRPAVAVVTIVLVGILAACTRSAESAQPAKRATATTSAAPRNSHALGAPGCRPASPVTLFSSFLPQVKGTGHGASLWGLLMFPHALPARVGDHEKIVWRMTGTGLLTLRAIAPDGKHHRLAWGPEAHQSSNWDKPGAEWGAGYVFTAPGCWDLRAIRAGATADVWISVIAR
jgi:hypothetical protein